ncbi:hypothetical protein BC826DRAFT_1108802 [Russula brevipes]|nr:hypothetical protein BC826DRAFT_1108802 [Russula brevipes]
MDSGLEPEILNAKKKKSHNYFKITIALRPPHFRVFPVYSGPITIDDLDYTGRSSQTSPPDSYALSTHDVMQDLKAATVCLLECFPLPLQTTKGAHQENGKMLNAS